MSLLSRPYDRENILSQSDNTAVSFLFDFGCDLSECLLRLRVGFIRLCLYANW